MDVLQVTTAPAPVRTSSGTQIGATKTVLEPMSAFLPIFV